jgi:hypothetical protein
METITHTHSHTHTYLLLEEFLGGVPFVGHGRRPYRCVSVSVHACVCMCTAITHHTHTRTYTHADHLTLSVVDEADKHTQINEFVSSRYVWCVCVYVYVCVTLLLCKLRYIYIYVCVCVCCRITQRFKEGMSPWRVHVLSFAEKKHNNKKRKKRDAAEVCACAVCIWIRQDQLMLIPLSPSLSLTVAFSRRRMRAGVHAVTRAR